MPLRLPGIRILNYIDDWLILAVALVGCSVSRDSVVARGKNGDLGPNAGKLL